MGVWVGVHARTRVTDTQIDIEKQKTGAKSEGVRDTGRH